MEAQSIDVRRAEIEFHQFASMGEPERAMAAYRDQNRRRGGILSHHLDFIGPLTPYLEIGSNAGHTSYMLENQFGARGFALDISADSLRWGKALMTEWNLEHAPIRIAGDALHLPFADNSLRLVMAFQMLSQFMDIEAVFLEVKRVLAPGGVFYFAEEPIRRQLSLRLYRAPYEREMRPWERRLHEWGLLGYLTKDVIGAHQEESFGIRQNHRMTLRDWHQLIHKHFPESRHELFVAERGWGEAVVRKLARRVDRMHSDWLPARLLGGTLAGICRKPGNAESTLATDRCSLLRCPDCSGSLRQDDERTLRCEACQYEAPDEDGVYNLIPSKEKRELYPGLRPDIADFCQADHEEKLVSGFYAIEGIYGNRYRWIQPRAVLRLERVKEGAHKLRVRGFATEAFLAQGQTPRVSIRANGNELGSWPIERSGLFVLEAPVPPADRYEVEILASPLLNVAGDSRQLTVTVSMVRLISLT